MRFSPGRQRPNGPLEAGVNGGISDSALKGGNAIFDERLNAKFRDLACYPVTESTGWNDVGGIEGFGKRELAEIRISGGDTPNSM